MSIQQALKKLSKSDLVQLIGELHDRYDDIDQIIERYTALKPKAENASYTVIQRQLQQVANDSSFIDYYDSGSYAARLQCLLTDIDALLREHAPEQALQATEEFIWLHESVLERSDDSNGYIGDVFCEAVEQWVNIAAEVRSLNPQSQPWLDKVMAFFDGNDYGVLDDIISNSSPLLSSDELTQLAWRFEAQAKQALDKQRKAKGTSYNHEAAHATIGMQSVAEAKGDMALFEKAYLLTSPKPNTLQLEKIIAFAIETEHFERAEYWLAKPEWQEDPSCFKALRNHLLAAQGNTKQLKKHLAEDFYQNPSEVALESYWEAANKTEQKALHKQMPELVKKAVDAGSAISMALVVQHSDLAENLLVEHGSTLTEHYYGTFLHWLERLDEKSHPLACIVCYRCLLTNLLDRGYAKAYHHGADYFHTLLKLDKKVADYKNLEDAQSYIHNLQGQHWRKRSFWQQANYPNKPV